MIIENNLKNGLIPDDFIIESENALINSGSFGDVYQYKHKNTQKKYAIKEIFLRPNTNSDDEEKLLKEIKILEKISTVIPKPKSLPNYYGYYCENDKLKNKRTYFIVFDLFPISLKKMMKSKEENKEIIEFKFLKNYFYSLLNTLTVMESMDICHRDLKPDNLLLDISNNITIIDFGEGRENTELSKQNSANVSKVQTLIAGTISYMAPEILQWVNDENQIIRFNPYKADAFSFGLIILEIGRLKPLHLMKFVQDPDNMKKAIDKSLNSFYLRYESILVSNEDKIEFEIIVEGISACLKVKPKERCDFIKLFQDIFQKIKFQNIEKEKIRFYVSVEENSVDELSKIYKNSNENKIIDENEYKYEKNKIITLEKELKESKEIILKMEMDKSSEIIKSELHNNEQINDIFEKLLDYYDELWNSQFPKSELRTLLSFHKNMIIYFAENNNPEAQCLLASMIYDPDLIGIDKTFKYNLKNAFDLMNCSAHHATKPSRFAQCELSSFYRQAVGVEKNENLAFKYANLAIDNYKAKKKNNILARAFRIRGNLYHLGIGINKDVNKAFNDYKMSIDLEMRNPIAIMNMGLLYYDGLIEGDPARNKTKAFDYIYTAANLNFSRAQILLSKIYTSDGIYSNLSEVEKWNIEAEKNKIKYWG